jgi:methylated-DNA-[protein]-cysteine S-methyltransferase
MTMTPLYDTMDSPVGQLLLIGDGEALTGLSMLPDRRYGAATLGQWRRDRATLADARDQLRAYFDGELERFQLSLAPAGTAFQLRVWEALDAIPYGTTTTYGEIAKQIGYPERARAVGAANGANPIPIIVPCHRVIGASGKLVGYSGGLERKRELLRHEGVTLA